MAEEERTARPRDASGRFVSEDDIEAEDRRAPEPDDPGDRREPDEGATEGGDSGAEDISDTPAPSIGPRSVVEREPVEERLARHDQSPVDAVGEDKRRQVKGKTYGPTLARQAALYLVFLVVVVAIGFGVKLLVDHYDQPPKHFAAKAPWAQPHVKQVKPKPLQ
jgi:hypothetical protein